MHQINGLVLTDIQLKILSIIGIKEMPRREIVALLNTPRTTIYDNLRKLYKWKYIGKKMRYNQKRGRPVVIWYKLPESR